MINALVYYTKVAHGIVREASKVITRSGEWPTVRKHFLEKYPTCAACGGKKLLNVHHREPFYLDPKLELDENNLITLCMKNLCHLEIGHGGNYKAYVQNVVKYAAVVLRFPGERKKVVSMCKDEAVLK